MIFYSWTALTDSEWMQQRESGRGWSGASEAMGITDDRSRAMRAGADALASGRAGVVFIEAVRPGIAGHTLAPCYLRTGVGWVGRLASSGDVNWLRIFRRGVPGSNAAADPVRLFDPGVPDPGAGPEPRPPGRPGPPGRMGP